LFHENIFHGIYEKLNRKGQNISQVFIVTVHSPLERNGFPLYMIAPCVSL